MREETEESLIKKSYNFVVNCVELKLNLLVVSQPLPWKDSNCGRNGTLFTCLINV